MRQISYSGSRRLLGLAMLASSLSWITMNGATAQSSHTRNVNNVNLDAGTVIPAKLDDTLTSDKSRNGDTFTATVRTDDQDRYYALPAGTKIEGVVQMARAKQDKDPGVLGLEFRRLRMPDGRSYPIQGTVIGLDNNSVTHTNDGRLIAKPSHKNDRLTYVGYGAGAGLLVSILNKGRNPIQDTAIGGGLGYLFGALQKGHSDVRDVSLKAGTELGVRLDRRVSYSGYEVDESGRNVDRGLYHKGNSNTGRDIVGESSRATDIGVLVGDQNVTFDSTARPVMSKGNIILVPIAPVMKTAKISYDYDSDRQMITTTGSAGTVRLNVGSQVALVNGDRRIRLDAPAQRLNGVIYVPSKFLEIATGGKVTWDAGSRTIIVDSNNQGGSIR